MEVKLIVVSGKASKGAVTLKLPIVIGRSRKAELTVAHPMISRRHCELFEVGGLLMIRDLGSLNGTVVEGQRVRESRLCPGNEFTLGPLTFRAEYEYAGDLDSMPAPKLADADAQPPEVESEEEAPAFDALSQTPHFPYVDPPPAGQLADFHDRDQTATEVGDEPNQDEAVAGMAEITEREYEEEEEPEPMPPPPPSPPSAEEEAAKDPPTPPSAKDDE